MTRQELHMIQEYLYDHTQQVSFPGTHQSFAYIPVDVVKDLAMVDTRSMGEKINITPYFTFDDIVTVLADGLATEHAFYEVDYDADEYKAAKRKLLNEGWAAESISLEDVQTKMLIMGNVIKIRESDTHQWHELTLEKMIRGMDSYVEAIMQKYDITKLEAIVKAFDEGDFYDYEGILQYAVFGKILY